MTASKSLFWALVAAAAVMASAPSTQTTQLPAIFTNIPAIRDVAPVQGPNNHPAFLLYQSWETGDLTAATVLPDGTSVTNKESIVPDEELSIGSPISVVQFNEGSSDIGDFSVFYWNQNQIISESQWTAANGWVRGSACPSCIDNHVSFTAVSKILSAMGTTNPSRTAEIRLVFQSSAGTIVEAERQNGVWSTTPSSLVTAQNTPAVVNPADSDYEAVAVQGMDNRPSFLFYIDAATGDLRAVSVSDAFSVGHVTNEESIIPSTEISRVSPLAVVQFDEGVNISGELSVFYADSDGVVRETRWNATSGWTRGSACPDCIDNHGSYKLTLGRTILYAMGAKDSQTGSTEIRVGFESADFDDIGTIVEVVGADGVWSPVVDKYLYITKIVRPVTEQVLGKSGQHRALAEHVDRCFQYIQFKPTVNRPELRAWGKRECRAASRVQTAASSLSPYHHHQPLDEPMDQDHLPSVPQIRPTSRGPRTPARSSNAATRARNQLRASASPASTSQQSSILTPPGTPAPRSRASHRRSPQTLPPTNRGRGRPRRSEPSSSTPIAARRGGRRSEPHANHNVSLEDYFDGDSSDSSDDEPELVDLFEEVTQDNVDDVELFPGLEIGMSTEDVEEYALQMCDMGRRPNVGGSGNRASSKPDATLGEYTLLPHQREGIAWMSKREDSDEKKYGGILADDTGLGKTIQACGLIKYDHDKNPTLVKFHPTLIVIPPSLVLQWQDEIRKFLPGKTIQVYESKTKRTKQMKDLLKADIVLTTYGVVRSEYNTHLFSTDRWQSNQFINSAGFLMHRADGREISEVLSDALFRIGWRRVILDEAHFIRNHATSSAKACCNLQTRYKWCLTATPLQNTVMDLHSLFRFLHVKPHHDINWFKENVDGPIRRTKLSQNRDFCHERAMKKLHLCLSRVMIRRRKDEETDGVRHLDVARYEMHLNPEENRLEERERRIYEALQARFSSIVYQTEKKGAERGKRGSVGMDLHCIFVLILRLRQACLHPRLLLNAYKIDARDLLGVANEAEEQVGNAGASAREFEGDNENDNCKLCGLKYGLIPSFSSPACGPRNSMQLFRFAQIRLTTNIQAHKEACRSTLRLLAHYAGVEGSTQPSSRTEQVMQILRSIPEDEKVIVFSQFTGMLEVLQEFMRHEGMRFVRYDGGMKDNDREVALKAIKKPGSQGAKIILMSLKAGGVGLNLAQCNHIILTDIWWNPAVEEQAIGRAHRHGQIKQVHVYKLVAEGTIESRILGLQEDKRELARNTLGKDQLQEVKSLTRAQIIQLITGRSPAEIDSGGGGRNLPTIVQWT
ncbi:hypothetical protein V5O48_012867 [Marasmius crinis-equi]|uniref:Uncharacterized protein n=1 Tax=Marasmius crinis-equi TaxID=585013 RepID=A0ABR3F1P9_9AGAR